LIKFFKIDGNSLYPYLKDGERVVCLKLFSFNKIRVNDIIVFNKKPYGLMIKRVTKIKDQSYYVVGTDPSSIDSRDFGYIDLTNIKYRLISWLHRKAP